MRDNHSIVYDKISTVYDISRQANNETVQKLIKLLYMDPGSILLDMGCGTGNYMSALNPIAKAIIGIDSSLSMIGRARSKVHNSSFICGDITFLPFGSETLGGAYAIQVLHHVRNKIDFLKEVHRVLKRDSYVALHSCSHDQMRAFWFYHYFQKGLEKDLERIPDTGDICMLLERSGFLNIGVEICYYDTVVSNEIPERYLDESYRGGVSTFALLTEDEIESGCDKIRRDISTGDAERVVQESQVRVLNEVGGSTIIYGRKG